MVYRERRRLQRRMPSALSRRRPRFVKVLAAGWLFGAVGIVVLVGGSLGWRGWIWLTIHSIFSLAGAGWELWFRVDTPIE